MVLCFAWWVVNPTDGEANSRAEEMAFTVDLERNTSSCSFLYDGDEGRKNERSVSYAHVTATKKLRLAFEPLRVISFLCTC